MALFFCKIGRPDGSIHQQELEAASAAELRLLLKNQGCRLFWLRRRLLAGLRGPGRVSGADLLAFNQELLTLLKAGLPIIPLLDSILEQRHQNRDRLTVVLQQVRQEVHGGASLSAAFGNHARLFPPLYLAALRAGERTGDLPSTIRRYQEFLKRTLAIRKQLTAALVYPAILVLVATAAVLLLLLYVVPTFSQVYADAGSQLPLLTRLLMTFTTMLRTGLPVWLPLLLATGLGLRFWAASTSGRIRLDRWQLRLPLAGRIIWHAAMAGFARTLATLLGSGIPVVEALTLSAGTLQNRVLQQGMQAAIIQVEQGGRLTDALQQHGLMPPLALRLAGVGEASGALGEMLEEIAEYLEQDAGERLRLVGAAAEPVIMLVMGLVIGLIILAMYLPVFKLAGTVG